MESTQTELEAAVFRRLVAHLQDRTDVQNIDMMNLAGFVGTVCRNGTAGACTAASTWTTAARATVYGMDYAEWKAQYQTEVTAEQREKYDAIHNHDSSTAGATTGNTSMALIPGAGADQLTQYIERIERLERKSAP